MKQSTKVSLIVGASIVAVVALAAVVGTVLWGRSLIGGAVGEYGTKVQKLDGAQKTFAVGQTAEIGPYDVTVAASQKDYAPSEAEAATIQKEFNRYKRLSDPNKDSDYSGYSLTDETGQYVALTLHVKHNEAHAVYDELSTSTGSWIGQLGKMTLNDMVPLVITPDPELYTTEKTMIASAKSAEGLSMTLIYRVPKSVSMLTLHYDISIFTKVSPIVGTEGMPRRSYEYTIGIQ